MDFESIDEKLTGWMRRYGVAFLRYSLAVVFIWFGALKIAGHSPAIELVSRTVYFVDSRWFVPFLGWWEVVIGACFLYRPLIRVAILLLAPQMIGTFLPLVLLPDIVFQQGNVLLLTMSGQYIVKNLLIIGAAIVIGAGARLKEDIL